MKRVVVVALSSLTLAGCSAVAESYMDVMLGSGGGYISPAASEPSATVLIYTPADTAGIDGRNMLNIPVGGRPLQVDYYLSRAPVRTADQPAVPWRGLGNATDVRVHVDGSVYVAAHALFDGWTCDNGLAFQPVEGRRYRITQVFSGMTCMVEVVDLATNTPVETVRVERVR